MMWLLPVMVLAPILLGIAMLFMPDARNLRVTALLVSIGTFILSLVVAVAFDFDPERSGTTQLVSSTAWIAPLGINFAFGIDAVSLWLILLTTFLMPLTILGTWDDAGDRPRQFYLWLLLLEGALIGVFAATDLILFYIFFELTLVPLFFLIGLYGSTNRSYAAYKFFVFTLAGSVFTFAAVLYAAYFTAQPGNHGSWTFDIATILAHVGKMAEITAIDSDVHWLLSWLPFVPDHVKIRADELAMLGLMIGFAVKVPLFPVHTWLPLAHTEAPTAGSVVLAGVLLKLGSYGMLRFVLPMTPAAVVDHADAVAVLCIIGIIYAALICWVQTDIKRLVAYSSVSHMGFCILGLFALNAAGVGGSVMYMINHGLSTGALFLCVGMLYNRLHTRSMDELSGIGRVMPVWGFFMVFFCLASVGLPGLNGFVGEFLTILGAYTATDVMGPRYAAVAALGLIFGAIYVLYMVGRVVFGPLRMPAEHAHHAHDLSGREIAALTPLAVACIVLGMYPTPVLRSLEPSIAAVTAPARVELDKLKPKQETALIVDEPATARAASAEVSER